MNLEDLEMAEGKLHETQTGGLTGPIMKAVRAVISQGSDQQLKSDGATTSTTTTSGGTGKYNNYASGRSDENLPILPPNLRESEVFPELAPVSTT